MKRWPIFLMLLAGASCVAQAQTQVARDLPAPEAVARALESHPSVLAARAELSAEEANRIRVRAGTAETSLRMGYQQRRVDDPNARYGEWDVALERPLRLPAKAAIDAEQGDVLVRRANSVVGDAMHEASRTLLRAWFAHLRERAAVGLWEGQVEVLTRQREVVARRIKAGDAPRMESVQIDAQLEQARAQLTLAQARERSARDELRIAFPGVEPQSEPVIDEVAAIEAALPVWRERVQGASHELALARHEVMRAQLSARRADADLRPDPTVGVRFAAERGGAERVVGLLVAVPLPGQMRRSSAEAASAMAKAAAQREAVALRKLEAEVSALLIQANAAREGWLRLRDAAARLDEHAGLLSRAYALGEVTLTETLGARRQALDGQQAATQAQIGAAESRYRLLLDAHMLWDFDGNAD